MTLIDAPLIDLPLSNPGGNTSNQVPRLYPIGLDGIPLMVDLSQPFYRQMFRQVATVLRTQADTSQNGPGEQSLDPDALWRRSFEDWLLGAGQEYQDRYNTGSVNNGYYSSKGIDNSVKWQITLLNDTTNAASGFTASNLQLALAGNYIYCSVNEHIYYSSDTVTWDLVTGTPSQPISSLASDGYNIYATFGSAGMYFGSGTSVSQLITSSLDAAAIVAYVNGRVMLANLNSLYNITATSSSTLPTPLYTDNNPQTRYTSFCSGLSDIYVTGGCGPNSYIWGTTILTDGTALAPPSVQGQTPQGEIINCIGSYLGFVLIGTSLGIRFATQSSTGQITLGSLIETPNPVECLIGYNRFVWFGWTDYDTVSTGLGRLDLQNFAIEGAQPAYSSYLMATAQGTVSSVVAFNGQPVFTVQGVGPFVVSENLVESGILTSGYILYDLADTKVPICLDVQTLGALNYGSFEAGLSVDGGEFISIGIQQVGDPVPVVFSATAASSGVRFQIQFIINRDSTTTTQGPMITRYTLRSYPAPLRPLTWQLPIVINEKIINATGGVDPFNPFEVVQALENMVVSGRLVTYQEGSNQYSVYVEDHKFLAERPTLDQSFYQGFSLVTLKGLPITL